MKLESELPDGFKHPAVYFACNDFVPDVPTMLSRILGDADDIYGLGQFYDGTKAAEQMRSLQVKSGISFKALSGTLEQAQSEKRTPVDSSVDSVFKKITLDVVAVNDNWRSSSSSTSWND